MLNSSTIFPYEEAVDSVSVGMHAGRLSYVVKAFQCQQALGLFPGGQLVVRRYGKMVLNVVTGLARGYYPDESTAPVVVHPQTPYPVYSQGKPLAALAIGILEECGLLNINTRLSKIIPAFLYTDKSDITILDILTHRTGILVPSLLNHCDRANDRDFLLGLIVDAKLRFAPKTFSYMPWEFGVILCEIVYRITGKTLAEFITEALLEPLELPALRFGFSCREQGDFAHSYWLGKPYYQLTGCNIAENFEYVVNAPTLLNACNPAFSLITDAASLAAFYAFLLNGGVTESGKQLLSEKIIRRYTHQEICGWNKSLGCFLAFSKGFMVGTWLPSLFGWFNTKGCFGHAGALSSLSFADHKTQLAVAIVTNGNQRLSTFVARMLSLTYLLQSCVLR